MNEKDDSWVGFCIFLCFFCRWKISVDGCLWGNGDGRDKWMESVAMGFG